VKKIAVAIVTLVCLFRRDAYADGRLNFRIDFNRTNVEGVYENVGFAWQGLEVELDNAFAKPKIVLSGFSLGLRRELFYAFTSFGQAAGVHRWDEGTYLTLRLYRQFEASRDKSWAIGPSFTLLYGIPGTTLDRTTGQRQSDGAFDYTHVFPMRNADVPKLLAQKAEVGTDSALLYPELSLSIRKRLAKGGINLEWLGGVRIIKFGIVDSNAQGDLFSDRRMFIPSVGMRVGFRVF
jgi:hypothetical protein